MLASDSIRETVAAGISGPSRPLPHLETQQRAFGEHVLSFAIAYATLTLPTVTTSETSYC